MKGAGVLEGVPDWAESRRYIILALAQPQLSQANRRAAITTETLGRAPCHPYHCTGRGGTLM